MNHLTTTRKFDWRLSGTIKLKTQLNPKSSRLAASSGLASKLKLQAPPILFDLIINDEINGPDGGDDLERHGFYYIHVNLITKSRWVEDWVGYAPRGQKRAHTFGSLLSSSTQQYMKYDGTMVMEWIASRNLNTRDLRTLLKLGLSLG